MVRHVAMIGIPDPVRLTQPCMGYIGLPDAPVSASTCKPILSHHLTVSLNVRFLMKFRSSRIWAISLRHQRDAS